MPVNILLFQHYSYQICNLLFSKLCWHNRLRPSLVCSTDYDNMIMHMMITNIKQIADIVLRKGQGRFSTHPKSLICR